jgi:hypothetical protein
MPMPERERSVIEAVARRFGATWADGDGTAPALLIDGKRSAIDVAPLGPLAPRGATGKPRLRFDKVATRLLERLYAALDASVPAGTTVVVTVGAPIRLPSETAASLEAWIGTVLARESGRDQRTTIAGNSIRVRVLRCVPARAPRAIAFVHSADADPLQLLDAAQEVLQLAGVEAPGGTGERWLVAVAGAARSWLAAYRCVYERAQPTPGFTRTLVVFAGGQVEALAD